MEHDSDIFISISIANASAIKYVYVSFWDRIELDFLFTIFGFITHLF